MISERSDTFLSGASLRTVAGTTADMSSRKLSKKLLLGFEFESDNLEPTDPDKTSTEPAGELLVLSSILAWQGFTSTVVFHASVGDAHQVLAALRGT